MPKVINQELFDYIESSPSPAHTILSTTSELLSCGYLELSESQNWELAAGGKYYVIRNGTSVIAFQYSKPDFGAFSIAAAHADSPAFRIKASPDMKVLNQYTLLNTERYGGMNLVLWLDRPLAVAGRILVKTDSGLSQIPVHIKRNLLMIPSLAIHLNSAVNQGVKLNPQIDTLPLFGDQDANFIEFIAGEAGVEAGNIISHELFLYHREKGYSYGEKNEYIATPRLDDLQCAFAALKGFVSAKTSENVNVLAILNNEEIGNMTIQGADSTFLSDTLERISFCSEKNREAHLVALADSFAISADNAHALHPSYPEKMDPTNRCYLNAGVVVKNHTNYATDSLSSAVFQMICKKAGVPCQIFFKRSDEPGGGTMANVMNTHVSIHTVDIGVPQLAMHSPLETAGADDTEYMIKAICMFYSCHVRIQNQGDIKIVEG